MRKHYRKHRYGPSRYKNFKTALSQFIMDEFPGFGGPRIREMFVEEIERMVEQFYPTSSYVPAGYLPWFGIAKEDKPGRGKSMAETKLRLAILPFITQEDIINLDDDKPQSEVLEQRIARVLIEAARQKTVLSGIDLSLMFGVSTSKISKCIRNYEAKHSVILPTRGTIHDLGPSISHKVVICKKKLLEHKDTLQIAKETFHSPESVDRYLLSFYRVRFCINKGMNPDETSFATQLSPSLVHEYSELHNKVTGQKEELDTVKGRCYNYRRVRKHLENLCAK